MDTKMNIHAIIQARIESSRLPGKVILPLNDTPLLQVIVEQLQKSNYINKIILATTDSTSDDLLVDLAERIGLDIFRGSVNNVLNRFFICAKYHNSDVILRVTADDPIKDIAMIDSGIKKLIEDKLDYISNTIEPTYPEGLDFEVFSMGTLQKIHELSINPSDREHVTTYLKNNISMFNTVSMTTKSITHKDKKLSIDTIYDYIVMYKLFRIMGSNAKNISFAKLRKYLDKANEIFEYNSGSIRYEGYLNSLEEENEKN
jgi:spore coat polysaccharide biosynthesis protein SpsF